MSAPPVQVESGLPASEAAPSSLSPVDGAGRTDRRFLAGCVTGLLLGVALAVPVAYALVRVGAPSTPASSTTPAGFTTQIGPTGQEAPTTRATPAAGAGAAPQGGTEPPGGEQLAPLLNAGLHALAEKNPARALELFQAAERAFPRNARVHNNVCVALNELGRHAEAVGHCQQALALAPGFTRAERNLEWAEAQLQASSASAGSAPASR